MLRWFESTFSHQTKIIRTFCLSAKRSDFWFCAVIWRSSKICRRSDLIIASAAIRLFTCLFSLPFPFLKFFFALFCFKESYDFRKEKFCKWFYFLCGYWIFCWCHRASQIQIIFPFPSLSLCDDGVNCSFHCWCPFFYIVIETPVSSSSSSLSS